MGSANRHEPLQDIELWRSDPAGELNLFLSMEEIADQLKTWGLAG